MKKSLFALAALSAITHMAQAQSTVTIYGILDADLANFKSNQISGATIQPLSQAKVDSAGLSGSRWGMRFTEDLGGGLSAVGNLESGFNLDAGSSAQGGLLFGRRAVVGLASTSLGTVTFGRNSTPYNDNYVDVLMMEASLFDPSSNGFSATPANVAALGTIAGKAALLNHGQAGNGAQLTWVGFGAARANNSIRYASPNLNGFSGSLMYGMGEDKTAAQPSSKIVSANVKYANGPLLVMGAYLSEGSAINQATGAKPTLENAMLGFSYDFNFVKVGLGLNRAKYKDSTATGGDLAAQNEHSISAVVPVGAARISAGYAQSKGNDLGKSSGFGLQALYSLSKRTTLYAGGVSTKNYDKVAAAAMAQAPLSNIKRSTTYGVGIRHTF
jgi:predicted porin